jgi:hypothetical protein
MIQTVPQTNCDFVYKTYRLCAVLAITVPEQSHQVHRQAYGGSLSRVVSSSLPVTGGPQACAVMSCRFSKPDQFAKGEAELRWRSVRGVHEEGTNVKLRGDGEACSESMSQ